MCLVNFGMEAVDHYVERIVAEGRLTQHFPAASHLLAVGLLRPQLAPPKWKWPIGVCDFPNPARSAGRFPVFEGAVIVPRRTDFQLAAIGCFFLVHIGTAAVAVVVDAEFVDDQKVDKRLNLHEFAVPIDGIGKVGAVEDIFEGVHIFMDIVGLLRHDVARLGIDEFEFDGRSTSLVVDAGICRIPGAGFAIDVHFDDVTASQFYARNVCRIKLGNVDAVDVAFDFFGQGIVADVVAVEEYLAHACTGCVAAHAACHFVGNRVFDERMVQIFSLEHPVRFARHSQDRGVQFCALGIHRFKIVVFLGIAGACEALPFGHDPSLVGVIGLVHIVAHARTIVDDLHLHGNFGVVADRSPQGGKFHDGEVAGTDDKRHRRIIPEGDAPKRQNPDVCAGHVTAEQVPSSIRILAIVDVAHRALAFERAGKRCCSLRNGRPGSFEAGIEKVIVPAADA